MQREDHRDRCGVVVRAAPAGRDVLRDHPQVEVPRLRALDEAITSAVRHRERREARRHTEALLSAAVRDVDAPIVDRHRDASERRHAVDEQQRVSLQVAQRCDVAAHSRGSLGVHHSDHLRVRMRGGKCLGIDRASPLSLDSHDLGPAARGDIGHPLAEDTVHADDNDVAGVHDIDERCLHARGSSAADRKRQRVGRTEHRSQPVARLVEDGEELRIEVAEHRVRQRLDDLGVRIARPRPHEDAIGHGHGGMLPMAADRG